VFFARAKINGAGPFWFTVDTGATLTVIDPAAARRANLAIRSAGRRGGVGVAADDTTMATTSGARIEVDGLPPFAPAVLYVVSVQANAALLGHAIDGVLGTDVLSRQVVEFNYEQSRLTVRSQPATATSNLANTVSFTVEGNVLLAPATLTLPDQTQALARLLIDTGSNGALTLTSPFVRRHQLTPRLQGHEMNLAVGVNGTVVSPVVVLPSLAFGAALIAMPKAALSQATAGLVASTDFDGIIGAELLRQFNITIDYPRRLLTLSPPRR
jgi:predicted aspartyl protease